MEHIKIALSQLVRGKKVLLIGFGKEGQATYKMLREVGGCQSLGIADINLQNTVDVAEIFSGEGYLNHINYYDLAFKSPGIVLPKPHGEYACRITSQTEVFLQAFRSQVIGITGTKGKSTVSSLLYHVLSDNGICCYLAGNIGVPVFEIAKEITPEAKVIFELSCHQLEHCSFSPSTAIFLNLFADHLDHYVTFEKYAASKKNIYLHQKESDVLYCGTDVKPQEGETAAAVVVPGKNILPLTSLEEIPEVKLRGNHNLGNCAFVYAAAKPFGITDAQFIASLKTFEPLHHRLELIGSKNGVDYYDDSISTTVESAISAVESVPNAATILLGGLNRGIDYTRLVEFLAKSKLRSIICMYKSGEIIYEMLSSLGEIGPALIYCKDLYEAAEKAQLVTKAGEACLLSPASASYGDFKNFEQRGDVFKSLIFG